MTDTETEVVNTDSKGRPSVEHLSDRQILVELLVTFRAVADTLDEMSQSPMVQAMMSGGGMLDMMRAKG